MRKNILIYLILIGFLLSFNRWDSLEIGLYNLIFSIIFSIIFFFLIEYIFKIIGNYYGLDIELELLSISKKIRKYIFWKREFIEKTKKLSLSTIITSIVGFLSLGYIVPILFTIKPIIIESKRIGRSKNLEVGEEIKRIIFFSFMFLWLIFSIIKYFSSFSIIIFGFIDYFYRFLMFFTYFSILPLQLLLLPIINKFGYEYDNMHIGDRLLASTTPFYVATVISILVLPILSLILDPISLIIIIAILYTITWLRYQI